MILMQKFLIGNPKSILEDPENLQVVNYNNFRTQEMWKRVVKRLSYALSYIPDKFKTQQMCVTVVLKYLKNLKFVTNHFKTQMCEKALDSCPFTLEDVPYCYTTLKNV